MLAHTSPTLSGWRSIHSGSTSQNHCGWAIPDELLVSLFSVWVPTLCLESVVSPLQLNGSRGDACVAVTCLMHFWQNDRKLTLDQQQKILPLFLPGIKPTTFRSWVWHSTTEKSIVHRLLVNHPYVCQGAWQKQILHSDHPDQKVHQQFRRKVTFSSKTLPTTFTIPSLYLTSFATCSIFSVGQSIGNYQVVACS